MKTFMRIAVLSGLLYGAVLAYNGFKVVSNTYTLLNNEVSKIGAMSTP